MTPSLGLFNYTRTFSLGWHYLPKQFSPFDSRINKYEDWLIESSGSAFQLPHHITSTWPATIFHIVGGPFRFFGGLSQNKKERTENANLIRSEILVIVVHYLLRFAKSTPPFPFSVTHSLTLSVGPPFLPRPGNYYRHLLLDGLDSIDLYWN